MKPTVLLAASYDLKIHAFDLANGSALSEFEIGNSQANRIVSSDNHHFFVAAYSHILLFDYFNRNKRPIHTFSAHKGNVTDLTFAKLAFSFFTCGDDQKIKIWDRRTFTPQIEIKVGAALNSLALLPTGFHIITCSETGFVAVFDARSSSCLQKINISTKPIRSIAISPDNSTLIAAVQDGKAICYLINNEVLEEKYSIHTTNDLQIRCVVSPDSSIFATTAADNTSKIWDLKTGELKHTLVGGEKREWVWDAKFTTDSTKLCTGCSDGFCKIWDASTGKMMIQTPQIEKCVSAIGLIDV